MYTFSQDEANNILIERIMKDRHFYFPLNHFFVTCIIPELLQNATLNKTKYMYAISFENFLNQV